MITTMNILDHHCHGVAPTFPLGEPHGVEVLRSKRCWHPQTKPLWLWAEGLLPAYCHLAAAAGAGVNRSWALALRVQRSRQGTGSLLPRCCGEEPFARHRAVGGACTPGCSHPLNDQNDQPVEILAMVHLCSSMFIYPCVRSCWPKFRLN